jgi:hypothetical protein
MEKKRYYLTYPIRVVTPSEFIDSILADILKELEEKE